MQEVITIKNFGGVKLLSLKLNQINILIGPQASGKSITVKLIYFFKNFFPEVLKCVEAGESRIQFDTRQKDRFVTYFPKESWPKGSFSIKYQIGKSFINIDRRGRSSSIKVTYSKEIKDFFRESQLLFRDLFVKINQGSTLLTEDYSVVRNKVHELMRNEFSEISAFEQLFVPAGRSFYANIQSSIFSLLSEKQSLDPFLIEFGSFYEAFKRIAAVNVKDKSTVEFDRLIAGILNSKYLREKDKDFLIHADSRKVNLVNASSGQQEILPLAIVLQVLQRIKYSRWGATIYIEEPEAHLFPVAQKRIVQVLARVFNTEGRNFQIIVTTHSPYILASFNNLIEAGKIRKIKGNPKSIYKIIHKDEIIDPETLVAYSLVNGQKKLLIDNSTKLISQNLLDSVSNEISMEFGKLLNLEF